MVIGSSNVAMSATTSKRITYTERRISVMRSLGTNQSRLEEKEKTEESDEQFNDSFKAAYDNGTQDAVIKRQPENEEKNLNELLMQLRNYLINMREKLLRMFRSGQGYNSEYQTLDMSSGRSYSLWKTTDYVEKTYEESENMTFKTVGQVVTGDGRSIDFDMELSMSREFVAESKAISHGVKAIMTDPLVINLESCPVSVSDQKWSFDIDGDGEEDNISMLESGTGYLVYDKNEDGVINNGLEMFGAKTGNGFEELSQYDEDKNGWIDENDSIYNKLSVWIKDSTGADKLLSLKQADVGAIFLGNVRSGFALKSKQDNRYNAQVKNTGMYLHENGSAGSIQQLDMVKQLIS